MAISKEDREAFVSGFTGTTVLEVCGVILTCSLGLIVRHIGILCSKNVAKLHRSSHVFAIAWDFFTVAFTSLLCFTVLADHVAMVTVTLATIIVLLFALKAKPIPFSEFITSPYPSRIPAMSTSRVWTNLFTVIAILAVDFRIFPRRFAKTETYGVGLMDVGVGCFVLSWGVVGREARQPRPPSFNAMTYMASVFSCVRKLIPYLVMGVARLLTVKATDYQQHVSEYGVHWNFFFTLAAVKMVTVLLAPVVQLIPDVLNLRYVIFGAIISLSYQYLLSWCGLAEYIITGPNGNFMRDTFLSANREGIFSCIGFVALYYFGVEAGRNFHSIPKKTVQSVSKAGMVLLCWSVSCIGIILVLKEDKVSRRMANTLFQLFSFIVGSLTLCLMILCDCIVVYLTKSLSIREPISLYYTEILDHPTTVDFSSHDDHSHSNSPSHTKGPSRTKSPSHLSIMSSIDYNQFAFFLLANVCTGLVNLTVDTINTEAVHSFVILTVYLLFLIVVAVILKFFSLKMF